MVVTITIRIDAIDVTVGSISDRTPSQIFFGSVLFVVLTRNIEMTSSSNDVANANRAPERIAGLISGSVI